MLNADVIFLVQRRENCGIKLQSVPRGTYGSAWCKMKRSYEKHDSRNVHNNLGLAERPGIKEWEK